MTIEREPEKIDKLFLEYLAVRAGLQASEAKTTKKEQPKETMLKKCRLIYMLIDEYIEDGEQKEDYLETMDKIVEVLQGVHDD